MASKAIKGLTIEISGDTTKLGQALKGVEKNSKDIQSELKQVERLLKLNPKNTILVKQQQELLAKAVANSKEKLNTLKTAQDQANRSFAEGKIGEDQYRAIQREVMWAERELKGLEQRLSDVNSKWKAAADGVRDFGNKTEAAGKKFMPLSAAAGAALGGIVALTVNSAKAADDLNTLSKQTGISTEDLQKFAYAADLIDVPLETVTSSLSKLTRSMGGAQKGTKATLEAFEKLGVEWDDGEGNLRDNQAVFYDIIDALGEMENATDRDAVAMELFGRSAQDLNPLILGGADALKELSKEAEELGLILDQETLDGLNEFNDELDKTKAQVKATGAVVGAEFGKVLLPILQNLAGGIQRLSQWFGKLDERTAKIILVVLALVAAIGPLLIFIGKVSLGISRIMGLMTKLGPTITVVKGAFAALMGPLGLVILGIAAAIAIGVLLYKNWDKIKEFAGNLRDTISGAFAKLKETVSNAFQSLLDIDVIQLGKDMIAGLIKGITGMGGAVLDATKNIGANALKGIKGFLGIKSPSKVFEQMGNFTAEGFAKGLQGTRKSLADAAKGMSQQVTSSVSEVMHKGTITVQGVNNQGELVASQNIIMDELRRGSRR